MCDQHDFVFEFDRAYTAQLIEKFEASPSHSLSMNIAPAKKGVYALYHKGQAGLRRKGAAHNAEGTAQRSRPQDCFAAKHKRKRPEMQISHYR